MSAPTTPARTSPLGWLLAHVTLWRVVGTVFLLLGAIASVQRFVLGLGRTTGLTDQFPWGLWIGLDFLGIGLAAAGFTIVATVHLLNIHRFEPIVRPAILTAFIGYMLVVLVLVVDLGRPDRFWHPLVFWNPHSVMFEITWCLILYSTVLAFEFAPVVLERFNILAPIKLLRMISLPLMLAGVILSTLHQSSFGSLYLIVPKRLHPLWYSPILPVLFFISCMAAGLSTVIFLCLQMTRSGKRKIPMELLPQLGKVVAIIVAIYGTVRIQDLMDRDGLRLAFNGTYQGFMFLTEFGLGVIAPLAILLIPRLRKTRVGLFGASVLVIAGFAANRMNTVVTGLESWPSKTYFPAWPEALIGLGIATLGITAFYWLSRFFNIVPLRDPADPDPAETLPGVPALSLRPRRRDLVFVALVPTALFVLGISLNSFFSEGKRLRVETPAATLQPEIQRGLAAFDAPGEIKLPGEGSPGPVTFRHISHVDSQHPSCLPCHGGPFRILKTSSAPAAAPGVMHDKEHCGSCHDVQSDCSKCHGN